MKKIFLNYFKKKFKPQKSYSLLGEDILIKSFFAPSYVGKYIDIGNAHPIFGNNTFLFYKMNWSGLLIDPHNDEIYKPKNKRPRDIVINACIKSINDMGTDEFIFYKKSWPELSSTSESDFIFLNNFFQKYMKKEETYKKKINFLNVYDLKKIFNYDAIDILSIDIEKNSEDIIQDFIKFFNPKIIIYEKNIKDKIDWSNFDYLSIASNEMNNILINKNYKKNNIFDY